MTEVPEHLLRRSRERRAALGLGGGEDAEAGGQVEPAAAATPAATAAAAPAAAAAPPPEPEPEAPPPPPRPKAKVPVWAMPVLVLLPFWAVLYGGAFGEREVHEETGILATGRTIYGQCSACHGGAGQGGTGPPLREVLQTFPEFDAHFEWVKNGSSAVAGQPYGARGKIATGGMPGFAASLSDEQITAVVCFERIEFGGASQEEIPQCAEGAEGGGTEAGGDEHAEG